MGILERKEYHRKSGYTHRKFLDKKNGTRLIKAESFFKRIPKWGILDTIIEESIENLDLIVEDLV